jgi:site-specific DNA-cytosine methylase
MTQTEENIWQGLKVLSLFDGISCWMIALDRLWIKVDTYYASEIDKYSMQISNKNHPNIIQVWDVTKLDTKDLWKIDLLIWWSPCQSFSIAGHQEWFSGKSWLFYEYVRILKEIKPKYFLLENVKMKKEYQNIISQELWVEPIEINSSLVSAQSRKRLYWTNIPWIQQPQEKLIFLKDILEEDVDAKYFMTIEQFKNLWFESLQRLYFEKAPTLSTMQWWHRQPKILCNLYNQRIMIEKCWTLWTGMWFTNKQWYQVIEWKHKIRKLTPLECERLQTLTDWYTEWVSDSQRYKMIGNWRTVDIIAHIFKYIQ